MAEVDFRQKLALETGFEPRAGHAKYMLDKVALGEVFQRVLQSFQRALDSVLHTKCHSGDQIKKTEMGRARSTYKREKWCIQGSGGEGDHLEDPGVDGKILLNWIFEKWDGRAWTGSNWLSRRTGGKVL
jgi:hypothetical protein